MAVSRVLLANRSLRHSGAARSEGTRESRSSTLQPCRAAVGARIVGRLDAAVARVLHEHAGMPAGLRVGHAELLDLVAHAGEPLEDRGVEAALRLEGG